MDISECGRWDYLSKLFLLAHIIAIVTVKYLEDTEQYVVNQYQTKFVIKI